MYVHMWVHMYALKLGNGHKCKGTSACVHRNQLIVLAKTKKKKSWDECDLELSQT